MMGFRGRFFSESARVLSESELRQMFGGACLSEKQCQAIREFVRRHPELSVSMESLLKRFGVSRPVLGSQFDDVSAALDVSMGAL